LRVGRLVARLLAPALLVCSFGLARSAYAQMPGGGMGMPGGGMGMPGGNMGGMPQGQSKKKKEAPPPGTPEMHAASGADDSLNPPGS